jgi:hypothetical protein
VEEKEIFEVLRVHNGLKRKYFILGEMKGSDLGRGQKVWFRRENLL